MQNIYSEQTEFFKTPTRAQLAHLNKRLHEAAYELASTSEVMPVWVNPELNLTYQKYYTFEQGIAARGISSSKSVVIYLDTETIPYGLFISAEGFTRLIKEFHLTASVYHMEYDVKTKLISLNKTTMKVGKFFKILNPSISDKFMNTVVSEWFAETSNRTVNVLSLKASDLYKDGIGPVSCMTGAIAVKFWDVIGTTGKVMMYNNRIVARCLIHKDMYFDTIYAYTDEQKEAFTKLLLEAGYTDIKATSECTIAIPKTYTDPLPP